MLRPSLGEIAENNESYYSVVIAVAKRAREIADKIVENEEVLEQKPVKTAVEEFSDKKYYLIEDPGVKGTSVL